MCLVFLNLPYIFQKEVSEIYSLEIKESRKLKTYSFGCMPSIQSTASFLYLLSPLELILIGVSFPLFPQRFMVKTETLKRSATSRTVNRSGRSSNLILPGSNLKRSND